MDILNSNDYRRGFDDGRKDAESGKDPDYSRMGLSLKFAIYGGKSLDTYTKGYKDAYREVLRKTIPQKVEIVPPSPAGNTFSTHINPQTTSTSKSMDAQRIELQLGALRQLEQFLLNTIEELHARMQTYNDRVSALRSDGLTLEIADNYDANYCIPNNQKLWQLTESMQNTDLQYIRNTIAKFEELLELARQNYNE
ncbi:MAG: hypothetical protein K6D54_07655 [Bacteroidales bacterium]|nr:hypothetical protein [Bacteroidales bacterium]